MKSGGRDKVIEEEPTYVPKINKKSAELVKDKKRVGIATGSVK